MYHPSDLYGGIPKRLKGADSKSARVGNHRKSSNLFTSAKSCAALHSFFDNINAQSLIYKENI